MPKLKIKIGKPTTTEDGIAGYARYRIDFEDIDQNDKYVLGWISPRFPECEVHEYLDRIKGWWTGWNREVFQEDAYQVQPFIVKLYRIGLKDELGLIDQVEYAEEEDE